ncbi:hypothetical protein DPMN_035061 [Dreissena polymorpha]|uniref:Uncharacterized protein n=1 Tax=Dreissena polymorpha TaxID=45954 RepID=A0A9D4RK93_DREPO|nr:hypothetical protein DPMN_035061 [Dreissena polymorpha]
MPKIEIDRKGVLKLLQNLKVDKAAGPDMIRPIVLKELRHEILDLASVTDFSKILRLWSTSIRLDEGKRLSSI